MNVQQHNLNINENWRRNNMSRHYFSWEEDEAHKKGERDASYGRHRDYDYDCHFGGDVDKAYCEGYSDKENRMREEREEEDRNRAAEEREHERFLQQQREQEYYEEQCYEQRMYEQQQEQEEQQFPEPQIEE